MKRYQHGATHLWFCLKFSGACMYGMHQLQLKRDTRVPRVCRPRNAHELLPHACIFMFLFLAPRKREKIHELRVHVYTFLCTRVRLPQCCVAIHAYTWSTHLINLLNTVPSLSYRSTDFFSFFKIETIIPSWPSLGHPDAFF